MLRLRQPHNHDYRKDEQQQEGEFEEEGDRGEKEVRYRETDFP